MVEVSDENQTDDGTDRRTIGGIAVLGTGVGYPSTYSPAPATTTPTGTSNVPFRDFCLVFMWKDVDGLIGAAGNHYFQLQTPHDGSCPNSNG